MDELSADARQLIQRALSSREEGLSAQQRKELWMGIGQRIAPPGSVALESARKSSGASKGLGPLVKGVAALGTVAALAWVGDSLLDHRAPPPAIPRAPAPTQQLFTPSEPAAPAPAPLPAAESARVENTAPLPARPRAASRMKRSVDKNLRSAAPVEPPPSVAPEVVVLEEKPAVPPASARESLHAELLLLNRSYALLDAGKPTQALALLGEHRAKHPNPVLAEEAQAARAIAECRLAVSQEGRRARAETFLAHAKRSPLAERVRRACGVTGSK